MAPREITTRRLTLRDMDDAAVVHRKALDDRLPWLAGLHSPAEDAKYFRDKVFSDCAVWGAFEGEALVGVVAFREGWVDQLHVLPGAQRRGVGSTLLAVAQRAFSSLSLWSFQANGPARSFYEGRGFRPVRETDGRGNEEREPDILYHWTRDTSGAHRPF
jgi:GNAT superfamily N-acetyltransferase